jgi:hypothetical protein
MDTLIALFALLVSAVSVGVALRSNATAKHALRSAREEFDRSGAVLEITNVYRYDKGEFVGVELKVANNGRTPTTITDAGFRDSGGNATVLEESERLEPGGVGLFWFPLEEFEILDFDYESLHPFVETGHGYFYGDPLTPDSAQDVRAHCEGRSGVPVSKPLANPAND